MARIYPSNLDRAVPDAVAAEIDVVRRLEQGLSNAYSVFHSVCWSSGSGVSERHGEVDVVVVNQSGDLVLLEVKSGGVDFRAGGIYKRYGNVDKDVTAQVRTQ